MVYLGAAGLSGLLMAFVGGCSSVPRELGGTAGGSSKQEVVRNPESGTQRTVVPGVAGEPDIRVRLSAGVGSLKVGASGGLIWASAIGDSKPAARLAAPVTVKITSLGWEVSDAAGLTGKFDRSMGLRLVAQFETGPDTAISKPGAAGVVGAGSSRSSVLGSSAMAGGSSAPRTSTPTSGGKKLIGPAQGLPVLTIDGHRYPGSFNLTARSDVGMWAFDVVQQVGVEEYLKGVVAAEMYSSWPVSSFCAQAVAARSYAIHERQRARLSGTPFDVESTIRDQAYKGSEYVPQVSQAVEETRGVILTWNGAVMRAYFSSSSGGRPAAAKDTWPTGRGFEYNLAGPLQAQPREEMGQTSPYYRWTVSRTREDLSRRLRQWGIVSGHPVKAIGSIKSAVVVDRNAVGRPTRFDVTDTRGSTFSLTSEQLRQASNQSSSSLTNVVKENRVNSGDMEWSIVGDVVTIKGRGFGHGVGLCQWSAKEMGDRGFDWRTILQRFYPGAKIEKAY